MTRYQAYEHGSNKKQHNERVLLAACRRVWDFNLSLMDLVAGPAERSPGVCYKYVDCLQFGNPENLQTLTTHVSIYPHILQNTASHSHWDTLVNWS
jgi:hypothetical protein